MSISLTKFDQSAIVILKKLAKHFPIAMEVGFDELFPEFEGDNQKRAAHIGVLAFLRHENFITHEMSSTASFIITRAGLDLFEYDIVEHLKIKLEA